MNVGVYVGSGDAQAGGGHAFVRAVLQGLDDIETKHTLRVLHSGLDEMPALRRLPLSRVAAPVRRTIVGAVTDRLRSRADRRRRWERRVAAELDDLSLHFVWFLTPATLPTHLPYAMTVWDLAHRVEPAFPEVRTTGWTWDVRETHYRRWLPRATYAVIGACAGRDELVRCYGVNPRRIRVLPLVAPLRNDAAATPVRAARSASAPTEQPYVFYPAQFWPHKNHIGLLLALRRIIDDGRLDLRLVLAGSDKGNLAHVRSVVRDLNLEDRVTFAGFVSDAELVSLYRNAAALVFPSFFGPDNLPPLEAMQLDCPVIAADVPGAAEQLGDAAVLVDPRDAREWANAIVRVCADGALRDRLIARGRERASRWTARDYAATIVKTIDEFETERRCWSYTVEYTHT